MNSKCLLGFHDWSIDCEKCSKCAKQRVDSHAWDGCKCSKCGQTQHTWRSFGVGFACSKCQEKKFKDYKEWLIAKYGAQIPKLVDKYTGAIRHQVDEFLLSEGEEECQQMEQQYAEENSRFLGMSSQ